MLQPVFTSFSEKIWRIYPDPSHACLAVESRDSDNRKMYGWAVDLDQPIAVPLIMGQNWWRSLQTVHEGCAVWQGIEEEGLPIPQGLYVYDQTTGALLWKEPEWRFISCGPEVIIAGKSMEPERVRFLETKSGKLRDEILRADLPLDFLEAYEQRRLQGLRYPQHLSPDTDQYADVKEKMPPLAEQQIGPMGYLALRDYQIAHRYFLHPDSKTIEGHITILQNGMATQAALPTGEYRNGFALDSFFVMNNWLVWVEFPGRLGRLQLW